MGSNKLGGIVSGRVTGDGAVGGLVGWTDGGTISNSYATTLHALLVKSSEYTIGGLVGQNDDGTVSNSYWDKKASGLATSDGSPKSAGKTTRKMKKATGPGKGIYTGWDTGIWDFSDTASYPALRWPGAEQQTSQ